MDTRLWGGPLDLLGNKYTEVHAKTPGIGQDSSSSSEDELEYHTLVRRMAATAGPGKAAPVEALTVRPLTTSQTEGHSPRHSPGGVLNLSQQFLAAAESGGFNGASAQTPTAQTPSSSMLQGVSPDSHHAYSGLKQLAVMLTPTRAPEAQVEDVPSPSPVSWPRAAAPCSFGRGDGMQSITPPPALTLIESMVASPTSSPPSKAAPEPASQDMQQYLRSHPAPADSASSSPALSPHLHSASSPTRTPQGQGDRRSPCSSPVQGPTKPPPKFLNDTAEVQGGNSTVAPAPNPATVSAAGVTDTQQQRYQLSAARVRSMVLTSDSNESDAEMGQGQDADAPFTFSGKVHHCSPITGSPVKGDADGFVKATLPMVHIRADTTDSRDGSHPGSTPFAAMPWEAALKLQQQAVSEHDRHAAQLRESDTDGGLARNSFDRGRDRPTSEVLSDDVDALALGVQGFRAKDTALQQGKARLHVPGPRSRGRDKGKRKQQQPGALQAGLVYLLKLIVLWLPVVGCLWGAAALTGQTAALPSWKQAQTMASTHARIASEFVSSHGKAAATWGQEELPVLWQRLKAAPGVYADALVSSWDFFGDMLNMVPLNARAAFQHGTTVYWPLAKQWVASVPTQVLEDLNCACPSSGHAADELSALGPWHVTFCWVVEGARGAYSQVLKMYHELVKTAPRIQWHLAPSSLSPLHSDGILLEMEHMMEGSAEQPTSPHGLPAVQQAHGARTLPLSGLTLQQLLDAADALPRPALHTPEKQPLAVRVYPLEHVTTQQQAHGSMAQMPPVQVQDEELLDNDSSLSSVHSKAGEHMGEAAQLASAQVLQLLQEQLKRHADAADLSDRDATPLVLAPPARAGNAGNMVSSKVGEASWHSESALLEVSVADAVDAHTTDFALEDAAAAGSAAVKDGSAHVASQGPEHVLQNRINKLPTYVRRVLKVAQQVLRWSMAATYYVTLGLLAVVLLTGSLLVAMITFVPAVLQSTSIQRQASVAIGASMSQGVSVLGHVNNAALGVAAALQRAVSASLAPRAAVAEGTQRMADFRWLRPNRMYARAGSGRPWIMRWLRTRCYVIPDDVQAEAAAQHREVNELVRQLTPGSPMYNLHAAAQAAHTPARQKARYATQSPQAAREPAPTPATGHGARQAARHAANPTVDVQPEGETAPRSTRRSARAASKEPAAAAGNGDLAGATAAPGGQGRKLRTPASAATTPARVTRARAASRQ